MKPLEYDADADVGRYDEDGKGKTETDNWNLCHQLIQRFVEVFNRLCVI